MLSKWWMPRQVYSQEPLSNTCDQQGSCWELQEMRSPFYVPRARKGATGVEWDQEGPETHVLVPGKQSFRLAFPFPVYPFSHGGLLRSWQGVSQSSLPALQSQAKSGDSSSLDQQATSFLSKDLRLWKLSSYNQQMASKPSTPQLRQSSSWEPTQTSSGRSTKRWGWAVKLRTGLYLGSAILELHNLGYTA